MSPCDPLQEDSISQLSACVLVAASCAVLKGGECSKPGYVSQTFVKGVPELALSSPPDVMVGWVAGGLVWA